MKKNTKCMFLPASRALRKVLHELDKKPHDRLMQTKEISRPRTLKLLNGEVVQYEGP